MRTQFSRPLRPRHGPLPEPSRGPHRVDGLLIIDKPVGPTSHDVVARVRRTLRERRIGHTGTLDPNASGVLALVVGRATRLAQFLTSDEKVYEATVQLGVSTDTDDAEGTAVGLRFDGPWPAPSEVEAALNAFVGTSLQRPPIYSAKKIQGRRSYAMARAAASAGGAGHAEAPQPAPVEVALHNVQIAGYGAGLIQLTLTCSAGFYVRALARDLGARLGTGGHLAGLRRTRSGTARLDRALNLATLEHAPARAVEALVPMVDMLPEVAVVRLTAAGAGRAQHGALLGSSDVDWSVQPAGGNPAREPWSPDAPVVKLVAPDGGLLGLARPSSPSEGRWRLHPSVVLC